MRKDQLGLLNWLEVIDKTYKMNNFKPIKRNFQERTPLSISESGEEPNTNVQQGSWRQPILLDSDQEDCDNGDLIEQRDKPRRINTEHIINLDPPKNLIRISSPSKNSTQLPEVIDSPEIEEVLIDNSEKVLGKMRVNVLALIPDWQDVRFHSRLELTILDDPSAKAQLFCEKRLVAYVDDDMSLLNYFIKRNMIELKINKESEPVAVIKVCLLNPENFISQPEPIVDKTEKPQGKKNAKKLINERAQSFKNLFLRVGMKKEHKALIKAFNDSKMSKKKLPKTFTSLPLNESVYDPFVRNDSLLDDDDDELMLIEKCDKTDKNKDDLKEEFITCKYDFKDKRLNRITFNEVPIQLNCSLRQYQLFALNWMLAHEDKFPKLYETLSSAKSGNELHPLYEAWRSPAGKRYYLNIDNGDITDIQPHIAKYTRGGILADDMGLGKTVMMLALILANPWKEDEDFLKQRPITSKKEKCPKSQSVVDKTKHEELDEEEDIEIPTKRAKLLKKKKKEDKNSNNGDSEKVEEINISDDMEKEREEDTSESKHESSKNEGETADMEEEQEEKEEIEEEKESEGKEPKNSGFPPLGLGGTLIVCPPILREQWKSEILKKTQKGALKVFVYDGNKNKITPKTASRNDVVITSYRLLADDSRKPKSTIFNILWHRVVLDEAHTIRTKEAQWSQAAFRLQAKYRWGLTGTPIQNKYDDLYSLLHFLKIDPWGLKHSYWKSLLHRAQKENNAQLLYNVLKPIMLRRTKETLSTRDKNEIKLPPKNLYTKLIALSPEEAKYYEDYKKTAQQEFLLLSKKQETNVYFHIFKRIILMRQICDHPALVNPNLGKIPREVLNQKLQEFLEDKGISLDDPSLTKANISVKALSERVEDLKKGQLDDCVICLQKPETIAFTICGHLFCEECIAEHLTQSDQCPCCKGVLQKDDILVFYRDYAVKENFEYKPSSKLIAVMNEIKNIAKKKEKCVCFTQWMGMMDFFELEMKAANIKYLRLDGRCSKEKKTQILSKFSDDEEEVTVLMVSLMLGGVGLNLTKANHILLVEPWWNPGVEAQAIERVYRIGQNKPVFVTRFLCAGTIEQRMIDLQESKKDILNVTLARNPKDSANNFKFLLDADDE